MELVDVVIVGGGPAGLSAALGLSRCMRRVAIFDDGIARNDVARAIHGFITRDGVSPHELKRIAREELHRYGVDVAREHVSWVRRVGKIFELRTKEGTRIRARKIVLATGVVDVLPDVEGFHAFYGTSIFHCPHCDGYEVRGKRLAVLAAGKEGVELAMSLQVWTDDVILLTNGARLDTRRRALLKREGVTWNAKRISRFDGRRGRLESVIFDDGERLPRDGIFFHLGMRQRSTLPAELGCEFDRHGAVKRANRGEESTAHGVYVVGDASEDARLIVVAAAEGARAALHIHKRLRVEDRAR